MTDSEPKSAVDEVIERMDEYYLSKEDWDSVVELGVDQNKDDLVLKKISAATKAALTKKYNGSEHPIPFHKGQNIGKPKKLAMEPLPDLEDVYDLDEANEEASDDESQKNSTKILDDVSADKLIQVSKKRKTSMKNKAKNITTEQWKKHLYGYWEKHGGAEKIQILDSIDWDAWLYGQSQHLPVELEYDTSLAKEVYSLASDWDAARATSDITQLKFKESDLDKFDSNQIISFLERLQSYPPLPLSHVRHLGMLYKFAATSNAEVRFRFYELALADAQSECAKAFAAQAVNWIVGADSESGLIIGRMKFCRPTFRYVYKVDEALAVKVWQSKKDAFHPIAKRLIDKDLKLN
ncbi:hypothetical protein C0993_006441 [Termitomyces sp. T159_Od127]|nr:hypothetical protein C0993_006441 [Termitomyces sp. T159_Od127]